VSAIDTVRRDRDARARKNAFHYIALWRGAAMEANRIVAVVQSSEGEIREISGESTPMAWCCGRKKAGA
jgi:hypothetical protein